MERLARFRNSAWIILMVVAGCRQPKEAAVAPDVFVNTGNSGLKQREGYLYYHDKKFSGRTVELYPNGDTALLIPYINGKEEGWSYRWYEGKKPAEERFYAAGKKQGVHKGWWENGQPIFEYHFKDDEHDGEAKEWFGSGKISRLFHYVKGHEEGLEQMWWENGKLRANYVVKDGEQFGLIGRKLCKNEWNEK